MEGRDTSSWLLIWQQFLLLINSVEAIHHYIILSMQFAKGNKKPYCDGQLHSDVSNFFTFAIKDLLKGKNSTEMPICCDQCKFPLLRNVCSFCSAQNMTQIKEEGVRKVVYKENLPESKRLVESLILCIDLSGSMNISYSSTFQKVNEDYVIRVLGKPNYDFLRKRLGKQKVIKNYKIMEDLLNEGQSVSNIYSMYTEDESRSHKSQSVNEQPLQEKEEVGYITRKQIVQIGVSKYIEMIKSRNPDTLITIVYFSNVIEIPVNNFDKKIIVTDIEDKKLEEMIELGQYYAEKISIEKAELVGDKLVNNITKTQANGQTAMTPAIAFCVGLAKRFENSLHQIVVVTDGLSNVGFGQTQEQMELQQTKKLYQHIGREYGKKYNCVINVITFEDCVIGYDVIDQAVGITGGLPCQIVFQNYKNQTIISDGSMSMLSFALADNFIGAMRQFGYKTRLLLSCSNPAIQLSVSPQLKDLISDHRGNEISLMLGIKSISQTFKVVFTLKEQFKEKGFEDEAMKFTIVVEYERGVKRKLLLNEAVIKVKKGTKEDKNKEQTKTLERMVNEKLQFREFFEENIPEYKEIQEKLSKEDLKDKFDPKMIEKFKQKKEKLQKIEGKFDKLAKEKMSMKSRTYRTFKDKDKELGDDDEEDKQFK